MLCCLLICMTHIWKDKPFADQLPRTSRALPEQQLAIQEVGTVQQNQYTKLDAKLDQILAHFAGSEDAGTNSHQSREAGGNSSYASVSSQIYITTNFNAKCKSFCQCQCHVRMKGRTPRWLSTIIATFFYSYQLQPSLHVRSCNSSRCREGKTSSSPKFTYYFPT